MRVATLPAPCVALPDAVATAAEGCRKNTLNRETHSLARLPELVIGTTMRYIVEAENRGASFGLSFPVLPANLVHPLGQAAGQVAGFIPAAREKGRPEVRTEGVHL
jgi:hypothetical protein